VTIRVFQGEREMAADNKFLGQFDLVGIPPAPRGVPQVEVTFDIDANGIVHVAAKDKATNKEQTIRIQASGGLSDADIEQMIKDAEANKDDDQKRRGVIEARNQAEGMIHSIEKSMTELGDTVPEDEKTKVRAAIDDLKAVLDSDDKNLIEEKNNALTQASMKLGELAYRKAQEQSAGAPDNAGAAPGNTPDAKESSSAKDDDIVDADFLELDDDDKKAG
jgi:molecular chaperone DnaK